jgi:hypothetical protein
MIINMPPKKLEIGSVYVGAGATVGVKTSATGDGARGSSIYFVSIRGTICMDSNSRVNTDIA